MKKFPIIFLMGHTSSGKSEISIKLKSLYKNIEIISVDSISIYRDMNIGSAKLKKDILKIFPHKLVDIRDPIQRYSVLDFYNDSINLINNCYIKNKIPLFCGGSMFYFKILLNGISNYIYNINRINEIVEYKFNKFDKKYLFKKIKIILPDIYNNYKNNIYKLKKNISIFILQGYIKDKIYDLNKKYNIHQFYLINDKSNYYINKIIKNRFINMLKIGFEEEVYKLYDRNDLNINMQSIRSIGYKQMWLYFENKLKYNEVINESILKTIKLVKYQNNWIKNWKHKFNIIENNNLSKINLFNKINNILDKYYK